MSPADLLCISPDVRKLMQDATSLRRVPAKAAETPSSTPAADKRENALKRVSPPPGARIEEVEDVEDRLHQSASIPRNYLPPADVLVGQQPKPSGVYPVERGVYRANMIGVVGARVSADASDSVIVAETSHKLRSIATWVNNSDILECILDGGSQIVSSKADTNQKTTEEQERSGEPGERRRVKGGQEAGDVEETAECRRRAKSRERPRPRAAGRRGRAPRRRRGVGGGPTVVVSAVGLSAVAAKARKYRAGPVGHPTARITMMLANGDEQSTLGLARDVPVDIVGGVTVYLQMHIVQNASYDILLGRPFEVLLAAEIQNEFEGRQTLEITCPNTGKRVAMPTYAKGTAPPGLQEPPMGFRQARM
ncbi:hypothetical protein C8Q80DRAFT_1120466 [Daedaleopsis nitida]|nr:hypothetical protein C8Q80DRAFT_1120466 [Daedaleopsis nitida]